MHHPFSFALKFALAIFFSILVACSTQPKVPESTVQLGPRPFYLIANMDEGSLKQQLQSCTRGPFKPSQFSIGHRGAPLQFPEHTRESYLAAAQMGAGILECDVAFTKDRELVCRHSQCDLHTTTNILSTPLAAKCSQPFTPANPTTGELASARCCTSDITLNEFKTLQGKMDGFNPQATSAEEYQQGTANWRTDLYASQGTLLSHKESIQLFKALGVGFTPELKAAEVSMPFEGDYTQAQYAQQVIDEYRAAGVAAKEVWVQSFNREDIRYWIAHEPEFGEQAVFLDDANHVGELPTPTELQRYANEGIKIVAPPIWALVTLNDAQEIVASNYARSVRAAGLKMITWSLERSGPLNEGGGWYYQSIAPALNNDGDMMNVLHVLAFDVGVLGIFSDWPATVTYYANCMGLE